MIYEEMKQPQVADWEPSFEHRKKGTKKGWMETNLYHSITQSSTSIRIILAPWPSQEGKINIPSL